MSRSRSRASRRTPRCGAASRSARRCRGLAGRPRPLPKRRRRRSLRGRGATVRRGASVRGCVERGGERGSGEEGGGREERDGREEGGRSVEGGRSAERCGGTQRGGERRRQGREREREGEGEAVPARARAWMKPASTATTRSEARAVIWRGVDCELVQVPKQGSNGLERKEIREREELDSQCRGRVGPWFPGPTSTPVACQERVMDSGRAWPRFPAPPPPPKYTSPSKVTASDRETPAATERMRTLASPGMGVGTYPAQEGSEEGSEGSGKVREGSGMVPRSFRERPDKTPTAARRVRRARSPGEERRTARGAGQAGGGSGRLLEICAAARYL